jgi:probable F420-dependent oxidoreductase
MKFGVCLPNYGETGTVDGLRTVAVEAEKLGYDSVWTTDHILMSAQSDTPYESMLESVTSLAYLASITTSVKLGVSSLIMAMRNPAVVVKQLATIDLFSGGRVLIATSSGWNEKEFQHLGSNFHNRGKRLDESIKLIRELWSKGSDASFEGKKIPHRFTNIKFEPRPVQEKLTIWIAGNSKAAMKRAIMLGDAWHPNVAPLDVFQRMVTEFRTIPGGWDKEICVRIGLNPKAANPEYTSPQGERRLLLSGNMDENRRIISELEKLGVTHILVTPSPNGKVAIADQVRNLGILSEAFIRKSDYIA